LVRIHTHAAENVGEIDPARLDPNPKLAGLWFGIGRFPDLENLGWAGSRDPDLPHDFASGCSLCAGSACR
jgi:hypothetical protein